MTVVHTVGQCPPLSEEDRVPRMNQQKSWSRMRFTMKSCATLNAAANSTASFEDSVESLNQNSIVTHRINAKYMAACQQLEPFSTRPLWDRFWSKTLTYCRYILQLSYRPCLKCGHSVLLESSQTLPSWVRIPYPGSGLIIQVRCPNDQPSK